MPIDSRIALGYQAPQFESPVNMMRQMQVLQSGQQENQLRQAQMENFRSEIDQRNAMLPSKLKEAQDAATKAEVELLGKKLEQSRSFLDAIDPASPDAPARFLQWHQANHADPIIGPALAARGVTADSARADIDAAMRQPDGIRTLLLKSRMGLDKFAEANKPTLHSQDSGGSLRMLSTPGLGGRATVVPGSEIAKTAAPRAPMTAKEIADRNEAKDVVAREVTDNAGNVRFFNKFGDEIKAGTGKGAGKPTATYEKTQNLRAQLKRDTDIVVAELKEISKDGGLIDQSTGSGFGRGVDVAAGFFGQDTEGDVAIAKLQPIADKVVKMVPRFEGPQSDKDTLSYQQAGGMLADPTLSRKRRKEAAKEIVRLHTLYPGQFVTQEMAAEGAGPAAPAAGGWKDL
jgi:hypothetical protein